VLTVPGVPVERAFGVIVARLLLAYQAEHEPPLSDPVMAALVRVSQPHWYRVRQGDYGAGERVISAAAVVFPDLLRAAIDEVQVMKRDELARLRAGDAAGAGVAV